MAPAFFAGAGFAIGLLAFTGFFTTGLPAFEGLALAFPAGLLALAGFTAGFFATGFAAFLAMGFAGFFAGFLAMTTGV
ncbi:MAG: hypothetical protein IPM12_03580 [Flavobacteriales bacterium]|nr:hypothetical protein [Flavobacteriales bacterium]